MRSVFRLVLGAAAAIVAACGGGGGGSGPAPVVPALALLAGNIGGSGNVDGLGTAARFNEPTGVAVDASGNVYVTDQNNNTIRRIAPNGTVTTVAGAAGISGDADGSGAAARFDGPTGIAVDAAGNLYVADAANSTLRRITPAGEVTTLAGSPGSPGAADGVGAAARFDTPAGLALDAAGNLYVADSGNHTIRRVTPAGEVTTVAGSAGVPGAADGIGTAALFNFPSGVAVAANGDIYVADTGNQTIRRIDASGGVSTLAGVAGDAGSVDGIGSGARFSGPIGIAVGALGDLYVADSDNHIIRRVTPAGVVTTVAGAAGVQGADDGFGANARFDYPYGIAADATGDLYVAEGGNDTIRRITPAGEVTTLAGAAALRGHVDAAGSAARFDQPRAIVADAAGNAYVVEGAFGRLRAVSAAGDVTTVASGFNTPSGVVRDSAGNFYIADTGNHVIRKLDSNGTLTVLAGLEGDAGTADGTGAAARFNRPGGLALDAAGNLYVADTDNHAIRRITPAGEVTTLAGSPGSFGNADGTGAAARFRAPQDLVVDGSGVLYVADRLNHRIRRVTPAGEVSTLAGSSAGAADGIGTTARFSLPIGIGIDSAGNLYVADAGNHAIRRIAPSAEVTTVVGAFGRVGAQTGPLPASLDSPRDVAVRLDGELLIADANGVLVTENLE